MLRDEGSVLRRLWVFGDSLMLGWTGRSNLRCEYRIVDRSKSGANIRVIHRTVKDYLSEDLVVDEGGGNGLEDIRG